jgi:ferredoxin
MTNPKIVIVGSGPSALAAAAAVVKNGYKPLVIDATIGGTNPNLDEFQTGPRESKKKIAKGSPGRKTWLGSDLPYRQHPRSILEFQNPEPVPSYSFGGFSRIWGAACSFYLELDEWFAKFGLTEEDLLLTSELLGFKDKSLQSTGLRHSKTAHELMEKIYTPNFQKKYDASFSNLAINVELGAKDSCQYCNQCLTGCPYDSIWMSGNKFLSMQEKNEIDFMSGYFLNEIKVELGRVASLVFDSNGVTHEIFHPDYCFLATGVISTTEILVKSKLVSEIEICDSSTAFSAMLKIGRNSGVTASDHSLSQVWITNRASGAHFQIYSPSPGLEEKLIENFPQLKRVPSFTKWIAERIIPIISYLPSRHSGTLKAKEKGQSIVVSVHGGQYAKLLHHIHLAKISFKFLTKGYIFPSFLSKIPNPGSGYHFGASLPMGKRTNDLGQLPGISNLSIVDASILPLIEAGSITPSVMANAARIARTICEKVFPI